MKDASELKAALAHYYGSEEFFKQPLYRWMLYTEGVQCFAENAGGGAYWFLDIIGTEFQLHAKIHQHITITLTVYDDGTAKIMAVGDEEIEVFRRDVSYTDCPRGEWKFYLTGNTLLLPSEY